MSNTAAPDLRALAGAQALGSVTLHDGASMAFRVDDFTDPWREGETGTVVLLHGVAESSAAWFAWVPHFARRYRVLRPDLRGFGASTPMPGDHAWSIDELADDLDTFAQSLGVARFHLVAAKVAGMVALHFAARHPSRLASLSVIGNPLRGSDVTRLSGYSPEQIEAQGVAHWAGATQAARLGPDMPPEAHRWWTDMMGATAASTQAGLLRRLGEFDATPSLGRIACPTLVVASGGASGAAAQVSSAAAAAAWQPRIAGSELLVMPGAGYHVAASDADRCAIEVRAFIERHGGCAPQS